MKTSLLKYIVCFNCKAKFKLKSFLNDSRNEAEIYEGSLECIKCKKLYPIILGVPRLLLDLNDTARKHPKFFQKYTYWNVFIKEKNKITVSDMYGFGWSKFPAVWNEFRLEFFHFFGSLIHKSYFKNKVVLDAGCGQGRFTKFATELSPKEVIGFDLSDAVDFAYKNLLGIKNAHVVQANIYNPPFLNVFDFVFSLGVVHHLPNPEKGFHSLIKLVKKNGLIFLWLYGWTPIIRVLKTLRFFTIKFPMKFVYYIALFPALKLHLLNLSYLFFHKLIGEKAKIIPLWQYSDRSFRGKHWIMFDHLSVPIINFYIKEDLIEWLNRTNDLKDTIVDERYSGYQGSSWRLFGIKK